MKCTEAFKVLSNPLRMRILEELLKGSRCVTKIAEKLGVSQPAITQHIRALERLNLVIGERKGNRIHYSINVSGLEEMKKVIFQLLSGLEPREEKCGYREKCECEE
ncbi:winged helix-turn-helix transcriptional regulator [bacterium]|nr:winged helix-turn-helix transcriptional regulator [bacterium]